MGARRRAAQRERVKRQGGRCFYCPVVLNFETGSKDNPNGVTRDHVTPRSKLTLMPGDPGRYDIVAACWACNQAKGNMSLAEFMAILPKLLKERRT